jgi:hypothetical protein
MPDLHDLDGTSLVVDSVHDSIGTLADSIALGLARELLATSWTRVAT